MSVCVVGGGSNTNSWPHEDKTTHRPNMHCEWGDGPACLSICVRFDQRSNRWIFATLNPHTSSPRSSSFTQAKFTCFWSLQMHTLYTDTRSDEIFGFIRKLHHSNYLLFAISNGQWPLDSEQWSNRQIWKRYLSVEFAIFSNMWYRSVESRATYTSTNISALDRSKVLASKNGST